jgi:site-specific DNA-methyltransferase (adenine-specific)
MELYNGDCLELMKQIPTGSVDLIVCDPPYGTIKGLKEKSWQNTNTDWDVKLDSNELFKQYERILRENGLLIIFSQEPYTSELRTFRADGIAMNIEFCYPMYWLKDGFGNAFNAKRACVNYIEDMSLFVRRWDSHKANPLRSYAKSVLDYIGISPKEINKKLGHRLAEHFFYYDTQQFLICTEKTYEELTNTFNLKSFDGYLPFGEVKKINDGYKQSILRTFNLPNSDKHKSNVFSYAKEYRLHPTQKPVPLLEDLILTFSNENDTVLDNTMGSGSTGIACLNTNRHFIGMELDNDIFQTAKDRIEQHMEKIKDGTI